MRYYGIYEIERPPVAWPDDERDETVEVVRDTLRERELRIRAKLELADARADAAFLREIISSQPMGLTHDAELERLRALTRTHDTVVVHLKRAVEICIMIHGEHERASLQRAEYLATTGIRVLRQHLTKARALADRRWHADMDRLLAAAVYPCDPGSEELNIAQVRKSFCDHSHLTVRQFYIRVISLAGGDRSPAHRRGIIDAAQWALDIGKVADVRFFLDMLRETGGDMELILALLPQAGPFNADKPQMRAFRSRVADLIDAMR